MPIAESIPPAGRSHRRVAAAVAGRVVHSRDSWSWRASGPARHGGPVLPDSVLQLARRDPAGLVDSRALAAAGHGPAAVSRWVAAGLLERLAPGVLRVAGAPVPPTQCLHVPLRYLARSGSRQATASDDHGPSRPAARPDAGAGDALVTGGAALAAMAVPGFPLPCRPLVLVQHGRRVRLRDAPFDVRQGDLARVTAERWQGVATVDPARALADLAGQSPLGDRPLRQAVYDVVNRLRIPVVDLVASWRGVRHPGATRLRRMADEGVFEVESEGEWDLFRLFRQHPPLPDCQVVVTGWIRVDFVFLFAGLVLEYLGGVHDGRADEDATRVHAVERLGLEVMLVSRSMLRDGAALMAHVHERRRRREELMARGLLPRAPLPVQPPRLTPLRTLVPLG